MPMSSPQITRMLGFLPPLPRDFAAGYFAAAFFAVAMYALRRRGEFEDGQQALGGQRHCYWTAAQYFYGRLRSALVQHDVPAEQCLAVCRRQYARDRDRLVRAERLEDRIAFVPRIAGEIHL